MKYLILCMLVSGMQLIKASEDVSYLKERREMKRERDEKHRKRNAAVWAIICEQEPDSVQDRADQQTEYARKLFLKRQQKCQSRKPDSSRRA